MSRSFVSSSSQYLHTDTLAVSAYPLSVSVWFKPNTAASAKSNGIWSLGDKDLTHTGGCLFFNFSADVGGSLDAMWSGSWVGAGTGTATGDKPVVDAWNHGVAIWESASVVTVFCNGKKFRTTGLSGYAWNGNGGTYDSTRIGRWATNASTDAGQHFDGLLAHVAVWDIILSDDEMAALGNGVSPLSIRPASLKSYVPHLGRDSPEIDVVKGVTYTLNGAPSASVDEPPARWSPSRKGNRIYVPPNYGGRSLRFHGTGGETTVDLSNLGVFKDYAYTTDVPPHTKPMTMACWGRTLGVEQASFGRFMWFANNDSTEQTGLVYQSASNTWSATSVTVAGGWDNAAAPAAETDGNWHHYAGVFTSTTSRTCYRDGTAGTPNTSANSPGAFTILALGAAVRGDLTEAHSPLSGSVALPAIWSVALTANEIAQLAQGADPRTVRPQNLVFYVPELGGDKQPTDIAQGRKLTVVGATPDDDMPRVMPATSRKTPRVYIPPNYGGKSLRFRRPGGLTALSNSALARTYAFVSSTPVTDYPLTLSCYARNYDTTAADWPFILTVGVTGTQINRFSLTLQLTTNQLNASVNDSSGNYTDTLTSTSIPDTGWHHLCGVYTSATARAAFLDGGGKGTSTTSRVVSGINSIHLGTVPDGINSPFSGNIAHPAIWNVALTDDEVIRLAAGADPRTVRPQSLMFYVPDLGRDKQPIDIMQGRVLTVVGATPDNDMPRVSTATSGARRGYWVRTPAGLFMLRYPNVIISASGVSGAYTDIDESPDSPDAGWLKR